MHALVINAVLIHKVVFIFFQMLKDHWWQKKCGAQESEWTVILAHHLLSKLAVSTFYKMDSGYKTQHLTCPCQCGEHPSGIYSDTSIACFIQTQPNFTTTIYEEHLTTFKLNLLECSSELFW